MADDLVEAEDAARNHFGIENDPHGFLLVRLIRQIRLLRGAVQDLRDRVTALENKP